MLPPALDEHLHYFLAAAGKRLTVTAVAIGIVVLQTVYDTRKEQYLPHVGALAGKPAPHYGVELTEIEQTSVFDFQLGAMAYMDSLQSVGSHSLNTAYELTQQLNGMRSLKNFFILNEKF